MSKHIIKLSAIIDFFKDDEKLVGRAENAVESGHVSNMTFDRDLRMIRGVVHASMKDKSYNVEIKFDEDFAVEEGSCNCPRGQYLCQHMGALLLFGRENISVTDKTCAWKAPSKSSKSAVQKLSHYYPSKNHRSTERNLTEDEIKNFREKLQIFDGAVGFSWLLSNEPNNAEQDMLLHIDSILFSIDYANATNKHEFFLEKNKITDEQIRKVAAQTVGQSSNSVWLIARKNRTTASNFGIVLSSCRRNRFSATLFKRLSGSENLDNIKQIQWVREHEKAGIKCLEEQFGVSVTPTGLWLHECGFIGASPDGLVGEDAIVEVKCPYKYRESLLQEGIQTWKEYIITADQYGNIIINKDHAYFMQIQGQLTITKRKLCYLVVWTPSEVVVVNIKAEDFTDQIEIIKNFYLNEYIPFLLGEKHVNK